MAKFSEVLTIINGKNQSKVENPNGRYPIFGSGGIMGYADDYLCDAETVVIGRKGSINKPIFVEEPFWNVDTAFGLVADRKVLHPKFLFYFCVHFDFEQLNTTVTIPSLTKANLLNIEMPLPNLDVQQVIVDRLSKIDSLIALRKEQLAKLDELIKARFVEMFGSLHDNQKGFEIVTIDDLCTLIKDGTHQTPTYTEDRKAGFKFLSSKDVMTQKICWEGIKYIPADLHEKLYATIKPRRNDILMSKNGVNYGVAAVNDTDEIFDIYVSLALLRPKVDRVNPVFFRCAINNQDTKRQFDGSIKGIGVPNLHLGEIKKTKILVPPMNQQNEFVAFVEQTDNSKLTIQASLDKLEIMKKALMQEYFG